MYIEISLMVLSVAAMASILVHRHFENARGLVTRMQGVRVKADPVLRTAQRATGRLFSYMTARNAVLFANFLFVRAVRAMMAASRWFHELGESVVTKAASKTEDLSRGGAASFYLKQIKEGKGVNGAEAHGTTASASAHR